MTDLFLLGLSSEIGAFLSSLSTGTTLCIMSDSHVKIFNFNHPICLFAIPNTSLAASSAASAPLVQFADLVFSLGMNRRSFRELKAFQCFESIGVFGVANNMMHDRHPKHSTRQNIRVYDEFQRKSSRTESTTQSSPCSNHSQSQRDRSESV